MPKIEEYMNKRPIPEPKPLLLPLVHTTSVGNVVDHISRTHKLKAPEAGNAEFHGLRLVFFFYGRAGYENDDDLNSKYGIYNRPSTLLYDFTAFEPTPRSLLPFDSGGKSLLEEALDHKLDSGDFIINAPRMESVQQLVSVLYENNRNYFATRLAKSLKEYQECQPFQDLLQLEKMFRDVDKKVKYDHRAFTFEIHHLDDDNIVGLPKYLVAPNVKAKSRDFVQFIKDRLRVEDVISYHDKASDSLRHCYDKMQGTVERLVKELYPHKKPQT